MTREQSLQSLDEKYAEALAVKSEALQLAQTAFDQVVEAKKLKREEIEAYYEALAKKEAADVIISQGAPVI